MGLNKGREFPAGHGCFMLRVCAFCEIASTMWSSDDAATFMYYNQWPANVDGRSFCSSRSSCYIRGSFARTQFCGIPAGVLPCGKSLNLRNSQRPRNVAVTTWEDPHEQAAGSRLRLRPKWSGSHR